LQDDCILQSWLAPKRKLSHAGDNTIDLVAIGSVVRLEPINALADECTVASRETMEFVVKACPLCQKTGRAREGKWP